MKCPFCHGDDLEVKETRTRDNKSVRRKRRCKECGERFPTIETYEDTPLLKPAVQKRNGTIENFSRNKLMQSITLAAVQQEMDTLPMTTIIDEIEQSHPLLPGDPLLSSRIGEMVADALRERAAPLTCARYLLRQRNPDNPDDLRALKNDLQALLNEASDDEKNNGA